MLGLGIVGLPNVGKSTLFNAITSSESAEAANYPFCTIDPNIGIVDVPDSRLNIIAKISSSQKIVRSNIKFVDIAGLVKGASKGEGLGNKFLSNIREVSAICQVLRCFTDENITHVDGSVDPLRDLETINYELIFADMDILTKALSKQKKLIKTNKEAIILVAAIEKSLALLEKGEFLYSLTEDEKHFLSNYSLLTMKPMLLVANVKESDLKNGNQYTEVLEKHAAEQGLEVIRISSQTEYEIAMLPEEDRALFLEDLGMDEPCLHKLIRASYKLLGLISFFTAGPQEARAWTITDDESAHSAASKIHDDIQRGFIRAEVTAYDNFVSTEGKAKEKGLLKLEGKEYIVKDGDVIYFRFNV